MGWPQIAWIALSAMGVGISLVKHGKPRELNYNFWVTPISLGIEVLVLYKCRFWDKSEL